MTKESWLLKLKNNPYDYNLQYQLFAIFEEGTLAQARKIAERLGEILVPAPSLVDYMNDGYFLPEKDWQALLKEVKES